MDDFAVRTEPLNQLEPKSDAGHVTASFDRYQDARVWYEERFRDREHFMENLMVSVFFHLHMPNMNSQEELWKFYVNFCNLYGFYRFLAVMSYRGGGHRGSGGAVLLTTSNHDISIRM